MGSIKEEAMSDEDDGGWRPKDWRRDREELSTLKREVEILTVALESISWSDEFTAMSSIRALAREALDNARGA